MYARKLLQNSLYVLYMCLDFMGKSSLTLFDDGWIQMANH